MSTAGPSEDASGAVRMQMGNALVIVAHGRRTTAMQGKVQNGALTIGLVAGLVALWWVVRGRYSRGYYRVTRDE